MRKDQKVPGEAGISSRRCQQKNKKNRKFLVALPQITNKTANKGDQIDAVGKGGESRIQETEVDCVF